MGPLGPLLFSWRPPYQVALICLSWQKHSSLVLGWLYSALTHHFYWKMYLLATSLSAVTPLAAGGGLWSHFSGNGECLTPFTH